MEADYVTTRMYPVKLAIPITLPDLYGTEMIVLINT
jgi:hypothetical protein